MKKTVAHNIIFGIKGAQGFGNDLPGFFLFGGLGSVKENYRISFPSPPFYLEVSFGGKL
jgi:hypothetical protein